MPHVLVVEDDYATRVLVSAVLHRNGFETTAVEDGARALQLLATTRYDAIVLDLAFGRPNGFDILRELARTSPGVLSRVVVHTALPSHALTGRDEFRHVAAILIKPTDVRDLAGAVLQAAAPVQPSTRSASRFTMP